MQIVQRVWEDLCNARMVKSVISAEADCFRFTVEDCPCRVFELRKNWADGWSLDIKADLPNRKWQHICGYSGDSYTNFRGQMRALYIAIRAVQATVRTDYTIELADRQEA